MGNVRARLAALAATVLPAGAFDWGAIPPQALENLNRTPSCAKSCILDLHWAKTYAPECSQLPFGVEYGSRLCRNFMYQFMIDTCIKSHCNDEDRRTVCILQQSRSTADNRHGNWGKVPVRALEFRSSCRRGKWPAKLLFIQKSQMIISSYRLPVVCCLSSV